MTTVSDCSWSYLAGIIDGEGTISILRRCKNQAVKESYFVRLSIPNTSDVLITWLRERFDGSLSSRARSNKWKTSYVLVWNMRQACSLLMGSLPYLVNKRPQAMLALEMHEVAQTTNCGRAGIPVDTILRMRRLKESMNKLNKKGPE